jgi:hypothetical protein
MDVGSCPVAIRISGRAEQGRLPIVTAGRSPGHLCCDGGKWMAGTRPAITERQRSGRQILLRPPPYPDTHGATPGIVWPSILRSNCWRVQTYQGRFTIDGTTGDTLCHPHRSHRCGLVAPPAFFPFRRWQPSCIQTQDRDCAARQQRRHAAETRDGCSKNGPLAVHGWINAVSMATRLPHRAVVPSACDMRSKIGTGISR